MSFKVRKTTLKVKSRNAEHCFPLLCSSSCPPTPDNLFVLSLRFFDVWILFFPFFQAILDVMVNLQFTLVETLWKTFWRFSQSQAGDATLAV